MGRMLVSSCRCCVSCASCGPMQCYILYDLFVSDIIGNQIVLPYSSIILVMAVHVLCSVSLDFLQ